MASQLAHLDRQWKAALGGHGRVAFVRGEIGAGKSALLCRFAAGALASHAGMLILAGSGSALDQRGAPYAPIRDAVSMLLDCTPCRLMEHSLQQETEMRVRSMLPQTLHLLRTAGQHLVDALAPRSELLAYRSFETGDLIADAGAPCGEAHKEELIRNELTAVLQSLARQRPLLLLIDNLQWTDEASLRLLFHLGKQLTDVPFMLLGAYRPSGSAPGHVAVATPHEPDAHALLAAMRHEFGRDFGDIEVDLDAVKPAEARAWLDALIDSMPNQLPEAWRNALFAHTRGHPLFTTALLAHWCERGDLQRNEVGSWRVVAEPEWEELPAQVTAAIACRLDPIGEEALTLLRVASVAGESFSAQTLARALGWNERRALEILSGELHRRYGLLVEAPRRFAAADNAGEAACYQFAHPIVGVYLANQLDCGERLLVQASIEQAVHNAGNARERVDGTLAPRSAITDSF